MSLTLEQLWTAAGVLLGFQVTSSTWRIAREVEAGKSGDLTWLPIADMLNLVSMLITVVGVFILPVLGIVDLVFSSRAFGLALLLFVSYPFALVGHYDMYNKNTPRSYSYLPTQEKIVLILALIAAIIYIVLSFIR